ncbi:MAG TPA: translocation/assembly module TamB domain-containing protein [Niabella sp.]|nr:translocation/assembly module TamB domain-containing protein [Niabella sp.]
MASILFLLIAVWMLIQLPPVQNWIIGKVTSKLSKDLQAKIEIKHVDFSLFNKMHLQGVLVEDQKKDTILSAGNLSVNITDWFFLKDKIELKYLGLQDAYIHLQRSDSVWRHQFLIDYFSPSGNKKKPQTQSNINLAIKKVDLKNILIKQDDGWYGQNMMLYLGALNVNPKKVDFNKNRIELASIFIDRPHFAIKDYKGNKPSKKKSVSVKTQEKSDTSELEWNQDKWEIFADKVSLVNGKLQVDNDNTPSPTSYFDGNHIEFTKINGDFENAKWQLDTITADVKLSTIERSGFNVKKLVAKLKMTPREMTFHNLDIHTNNSYLHDYFSMQYQNFNTDMSDFIDKVVLEGRFNNAEVSSDDIAFFAPALKTWKKKINLKGNVRGPVSALTGKQLEIQTDKQTYFNGDASLTGLPNINETFIEINAKNLKTTYADAVSFAPELKKMNNISLNNLQYVNFSGSFTGFINDFVTYGSIETALGKVKADVNMKLPKGRPPVYTGNISSSGFNLGKLLNDTMMGYVSLDAKLKGAGFNPEKGNVALETKVNYFDYNKYRYQNIRFDGDVNRNNFNGNASIDDPNIKLTLNGSIDSRKAIPEFDFLSHIDHLNFKPLNLIKDNISLSGKANAHFSGKTIDDFLGSASISDAVLTRDGRPMSFDSLALHSAVVDSQKVLSLYSNEFTASLSGKFNISDMPNSVTSFLTHYYPAYIKPPKKVPANQVFSFDIKTYYFSDFLHLIDSSLAGGNNSHIAGSINTITNDIILNVDAPDFKYKTIEFDNIDISAIGDIDKLSLTGKANSIVLSDSASIPMVEFSIVAEEDVSKIMLFTGGENTAVRQASLDALVYTYNNGAKIHFNPSSFMVAGKTWTIEKDGELEFRTNMSAFGEVSLKESNQEINIKTVKSKAGDWNDIAVSLKNLNLGDLALYLMPSNRLEGLATADILVENPGNKMRIMTDNFMGKGIRLDNDSLGNLTAKVLYDLPSQELLINGATLNPQKKDLAYDIHFYLKDKESQKKNIISLTANHFDLKYLTRFLGDLFSDIGGEVTGKFDVKGPFNALYVVGKGRMNDAGLKVNFTQCYYKVEDCDIALTANNINLDGIVLKDTVTHNPIYLQGGIQHEAFSKMFFDLTVSTRKPGTRNEANNRPVQVLRTTFNDNKLFYGDVKATGSFVLFGYANNTYMKIDAIASTAHESTFTIASSDSKAGKMPEWMVERKYGVEMADSLYKSTLSNIVYDLDVTANPNVLMRFVLDDLTGDEIKGRGSGTLNLRAGTSEPLSLKGRFDIHEGEYDFTFQSFFKKPFIIKKGVENSIVWNGDPMAANINLDAYYKAERVSFATLSSGFDLNQNLSNVRENVYVNAKLTGQLFQPKFKFGLDLDPNSKYRNDFNVTYLFDQLQNNETQITRQVTYLIVFNSFAPPESGIADVKISSAVNEFGYSTISSISSLLFNEINKKLNNELTKLFGSEVSLVFGSSFYNRNLLTAGNNAFNLPNQANFSGALTVPVFKDRFIISLGSSMEVPLQSSLQQTVQFLPDVTLEWLINASGTIRANLFYRENLDYLTTSSSSAAKLKRTGAGLSYRREFDRFIDLFTGSGSGNKIVVPETSPVMPDTLKKIEPAAVLIHSQTKPVKDSAQRDEF